MALIESGRTPVAVDAVVRNYLVTSGGTLLSSPIDSPRRSADEAG
jgi:hypothetical protein